MEQFGTSMAWYGMVQFGTVWYGMARYGAYVERVAGLGRGLGAVGQGTPSTEYSIPAFKKKVRDPQTSNRNEGPDRIWRCSEKFQKL